MARRNGKPRPVAVIAPAREQYPTAPGDPALRRAWALARDAFFARGIKSAPTGTFGAGKIPGADKES